MSTSTLVKQEMCLNPEVVGLDAILPKVDRIRSPFKWYKIADLIGVESVDFGDGWSADKLNDKRADYGYRRLRASIRRWGFFNPVFWDEITYGNGHHRLAVAIDLGFTHIPCTDDPDLEWDEHGYSTD